MKFFTFLSAFATAALVSADSRHQAGAPDGSVNHLNARAATCPRPMCKTPANQDPNGPPACAPSFAGCKFDKFPCGEHWTPKRTDTQNCYCIAAHKKDMDAICQEQGFKSGTNPWIYYYAIQCRGPANDQVCHKDCQNNGLGNDPGFEVTCDPADINKRAVGLRYWISEGVFHQQLTNPPTSGFCIFPHPRKQREFVAYCVKL
ncbi:hypothetical protein LZL87_013845 [Fusarium oxysporum]|nr:hypothetical protein LZL87_013845 [Fusarium oxysporum]